MIAHVLQDYLLLCSRDPQRVRSAGPVLACATGLPANERERGHLAAIAAMLGDDYERAKALLGELLRLHPRDALALQVAHSFVGDAFWPRSLSMSMLGAPKSMPGAAMWLASSITAATWIGGDAADIRADAAQGCGTLDQHDFKAQISCAEGSRVAAGAQRPAPARRSPHRPRRCNWPLSGLGLE